MRFNKLLTLLLAVVFSFSVAAGPSFAANKLVPLPTAWMDEHETFLIWYAKEKGWDKEAGLDIEILYFNSGMDILNALPAGTWKFAAMGGVPAVMGALRYNTTVIGIGNDESLTNAVMVRPDSPIAKVKGWNKDYPDVLGSPETVKGKTFLTTTLSSAHYALTSWLKILGLKDSDVVIKNMDQPQALAAYDNNIGDGCSLWAPHCYVGTDKGWKTAADVRMCKVAQPIVLLADTKYAKENPEIAAKFLSVYIRAIDALKAGKAEDFVADYQRFFLEWAGKNYTKELSLADITTHPVFNLDEQLAIFDNANGPSQVQKWQSALAKFLADGGRINQDELKKIGDSAYCDGSYLRLVPGLKK